MLITELKSKETIQALAAGKKAFIINCHGCKEVHFPEEEAIALQKELSCCAEGSGCCEITGILTTDYICNPENTAHRLSYRKSEIDAADIILVFSCGVGVQTIAEMYPDKRVCACCDTYALPGFQGVTPLEHDCRKCGSCYLNLTGGICPITACTKSLLNGQCGGAKNGMCEANPEMECGWERIYRRLESIGRLDALKCPVQVRDYTANTEL